MCFIDHFSMLDDPRKDINIRYDFLDIVFLTVCAVVSGAEGWKDIKQFGDEPEKMNQAFIDWVNEVCQEQGHEQIAIDGKTLRHSYQGDHGSALHSITAWSKQQGLILAQMKSLGKKNENASVLVLLDTLNINGALISVDAMNTQKKIADKIITRGADYVLCVKNNHSALRNEIAAYFTKVSRDNPEHMARYEETDAGHGRVEVRRYRQLRASEWITEGAHWRGLQTIIEVERERHTSKTEQPSCEKQYYISSLPPDVERIAGAIRSHWEVEAKAHWVLDVTFKEDDSRIRAGDGAENVAVIRRFALNLARLHPLKDSMRSKLKQAGWSDKFRSEVIFG